MGVDKKMKLKKIMTKMAKYKNKLEFYEDNLYSYLEIHSDILEKKQFNLKLVVLNGYDFISNFPTGSMKMIYENPKCKVMASSVYLYIITKEKINE